MTAAIAAEKFQSLRGEKFRGVAKEPQRRKLPRLKGASAGEKLLGGRGGEKLGEEFEWETTFCSGFVMKLGLARTEGTERGRGT